MNVGEHDRHPAAVLLRSAVLLHPDSSEAPVKRKLGCFAAVDTIEKKGNPVTRKRLSLTMRRSESRPRERRRNRRRAEEAPARWRGDICLPGRQISPRHRAGASSALRLFRLRSLGRDSLLRIVRDNLFRVTGFPFFSIVSTAAKQPSFRFTGASEESGWSKTAERSRTAAGWRSCSPTFISGSRSSCWSAVYFCCESFAEFSGARTWNPH